MSRLLLTVALLLPLAACDEPEEPPPTVVDKSADEAATLTADIACDYVARCGLIEVSCADCAEGEACGGCSVEVHPVEPDACVDDLRPDLEVGFGCQSLTAEEEALVDECLAALPTAECPSVELVQDWADGGGGDDPRKALAACDALEEIRYRCYDYGQTDANPGAPAEPSPG
ncbi:MAG: hypothetical protein KDK70_07565 [Myxococcales bacterium]|nr:hypothetical protein [Myxococcales bacterium]